MSQSDPKIVWVGTGEANPRNSVSWGDGVYRSADGGKTWKNMGLRKTFQIGRIALHPADPNVVYVGARLCATGESNRAAKTSPRSSTPNDWEPRSPETEGPTHREGATR